MDEKDDAEEVLCPQGHSLARQTDLQQQSCNLISGFGIAPGVAVIQSARHVAAKLAISTMVTAHIVTSTSKQW